MGTGNVLLRGRKKKAEALIEANRLEDARALYIIICGTDRRDAEAWGRLARLNWRLGRLAEAESCCRKAIGLQRGHLDAHSVLGLVSMASGKLTEAEQAFRRVLEIDDTRADAYNNLGQALGLQKRPHDAIEALNKALVLNPLAPEIHNNLGHTLRSAGLVVESEAAHRRAVELRPSSPAFYSNWLLSLNYLPDANPDRIFQYHAEWGRRFSGPITKRTDYANSRDPERKLCIGYVSPDFRKHPVACFLEAILGNHDHAGIHVICYADIPNGDEVTKRLRGYGGTWRMIHGMTDEALIHQLRNDGVDVLVDLAGHTSGNRLLVFAARPAPVQVSYLGYCNTTGLAEIDYRISDAIADPPESEKRYTEKLVLLDSGFSCYTPPRNAPGVSGPPCGESGGITFGSLNMMGKLNLDVITLWSTLIKAVPGSRLLIFRDELRGWVKERLQELFARQGVRDGAVEFRCEVAPDQQYLSIYDEIDIALDTFPWNGHTTACEALWMGVPVVTLAGDSHRGRMCASVLHQLGLQDFVAGNHEEYIRLATTLAADRQRLKALRGQLRSMMESLHADCGVTVTRELERAYRGMWRQWCSKQA